MGDLNMMGDIDKEELELINMESFVCHRGSGEDPFFNDLDLSDLEDYSTDMEWSQSDLSAIMDELDLIEDIIEEEVRQEQEDEEEEIEEVAEDEDEGVENLSNCYSGVQSPRESPIEKLIRSLKLAESYECEHDKASGDWLWSEGTEQDWIEGKMFTSDDWYEHPYCSDFLRDFYCLQNGGLELRDDLLDMLRFTENDLEDENHTMEGPLQDEITVAINQILVPEYSREGLKKLLKILLRRPTVNLKCYLENADPFLLAYIIWGLNFYLTHFAKDLSARYAKLKVKTQEISVQTSEQESLPGKIFSACFKILSWICDGIHKSRWNQLYEGILQKTVIFNSSALF